MDVLSEWPDIRYALRRSRIRIAVLFALLRIEVANLGDLARLAGVTPGRAHGALFGDDDAYRRADGLIALGLVTVELADGNARYRLTTFGHTVVAALAVERERARTTRPLAWT